MRSLVLGGHGMLGQALGRAARRRAYPALALGREAADVTDRERLAYWAETFRPEVIFNCAAFTQVDLAEQQEDRAFAVNDRALDDIAATAEAVGARLVHVSTDYVFDGEADTPYDEEAPTAPRSVYGRSKLAGERRALAYDEALVVRTSWLFGPGGPSFAATILRLLATAEAPLQVVDDQVGCPTYAPFLATALLDLAATERWQSGLLHYRNRDPVSWHGFATEIAHRSGARVEVEPVSSDRFPRPAPRPRYSVLDVRRAEERLGRPVELWDRGLEQFLELATDRRGSS